MPIFVFAAPSPEGIFVLVRYRDTIKHGEVVRFADIADNVNNVAAPVHPLSTLDS